MADWDLGLMETFLQQLINGISQGSAYALIALGYTMVYGVLRLINFAHSDVYMFGAFMGYYLANNSWIKSNLGTNAISAVLILLGSMVLSAGLGILIERFAYRPGRGDSRYALAFGLVAAGNFAAVPLAGFRRGRRHCDWPVAGKGWFTPGETELAAGAVDHRHRSFAFPGEWRTAGLRRRPKVLSANHPDDVVGCWLSQD
jgi:hypothetical protein